MDENLQPQGVDFEYN